MQKNHSADNPNCRRLTFDGGLTKLIFRGGYEAKFSEEISRGGFDVLVLSTGQWNDLNWVADAGVAVTRLEIISACDSYDGLCEIQGLTELMVEDSLSRVNLSSLAGLRSLTLIWSKAIKGALSSLIKLEHLTITSYGEQDLSEFSPLVKLRDLDLRMGSVKSLTGIEKMPALEAIELANVRGLSDIDPIALTPNLKSLSIENCSKISSFQSIGGCENLEKIWLDTNSEQTIDCSALLKNQQLNKLLSEPVVSDVDWAMLLSLKTIDDIRITVEIGNAPTEEEVLQICFNCNRTLLKFELTKRKGKVGVFIVLEPVNGFPHPPFLLS